jgi:hypothetical protein
MAIPPVTVGSLATAAYANAYMINATYYATKTGNTSRTSTTVVADDPDITVTVAANSTYEFLLVMQYEGATAGDLKYNVNCPGGATLYTAEMSLSLAAASGTDDVLLPHGASTDYTAGALGAGVTCANLIHGQLVITTGGVVKLQWAQAASSGTATIMKAGTFLLLRTIA